MGSAVAGSAVAGPVMAGSVVAGRLLYEQSRSSAGHMQRNTQYLRVGNSDQKQLGSWE